MTDFDDRPPVLNRLQETDDLDHERERRGVPVAVRGTTKRKRPFAWLPWVAFALFGLITLASLLIARNVGDSGDDPGVDLTDNAAASKPTAAAPAGAAPASAVTAEGGAALLPLPSGGLAGLSGKAVDGRSAQVQSVVADEGFWVGADEANRLFVFLTRQARSKQGESPFKVEAGQKVTFSGALKPVPNDLTPFGVDKSEGADQLRQQGQYVEAVSVALS